MNESPDAFNVWQASLYWVGNAIMSAFAAAMIVVGTCLFLQVYRMLNFHTNRMVATVEQIGVFVRAMRVRVLGCASAAWWSRFVMGANAPPPPPAPPPPWMCTGDLQHL